MELPLPRKIVNQRYYHTAGGIAKISVTTKDLRDAGVVCPSTSPLNSPMWPVPTRLPCPWDFPGKNTGVGCHFLLQGIFLTRDQTRVSCIDRRVVYHECHLGTPIFSMRVKSESEVTQSCPTLCDPMDCSLPGSSLHEILKARVLEWVAISFFRGSSPTRDRTRSPAFQADALTSEPSGNCIVDNFI